MTTNPIPDQEKLVSTVNRLVTTLNAQNLTRELTITALAMFVASVLDPLEVNQKAFDFFGWGNLYLVRVTSS